MASNELDIRGKEELTASFNLADNVVYKRWLSALNKMDIIDCPEGLKKADLGEIARFFKVERFVYEKNENIRDKLVSVFHAVSSCGGSVLVLINSDKKKIEYYFGVRVPFDAPRVLDALAASAKIIEKSLAGNFPGTEVTRVKGGSGIDKLAAIFQNHEHEGQSKQICTITGIAGLRAKEESQEKLFVQGMEKLVDSMRGEEYSLLLIADPVSFEQVQVIKHGYENLYSLLAPFAGREMSYGKNESDSVNVSVTKGISKSINTSITNTLSYTKGTSHSHTEGESVGGNRSGVALGAGIGFLVGGPAGAMVGSLIGGSFGVNVSKNSSDTDTTNESKTDSKAETKGTTDTESENTSEGKTRTEGLTQNLQLKFENKAVKNLLEKIDLQLKRLDASMDTGMWNCSAYCLADTKETCKIVSSSYQALLRGENSSVETGLVTEWTEDNVKKILPWLKKMYHPVLKSKEDEKTPIVRLGENEVTPTSFLSGQELAIHAGIPQSSVSGLPVLEMASFGREVSKHWNGDADSGRGIELGRIYHMGKEEELTVTLDAKSLASHTFITGSTGSGKSNTVYKILSEIRQARAKFLVVEPAKGEYKNTFGNDKDVSVYGTNPELTPLLRINPFAFPNGNAAPSKNIHILEHLDRLVEIFNVCWPMYAAMPAVLKDAIERSYEQAGWDLRKSKNRYSADFFPTFRDVCKNVLSIINSSEYSEESKGNYKGALVTRINSLTNGINGMIFVNNDLPNEELFDKNVIVDLSRVGSTETKALIMGLLVMKLQEYRMTSSEDTDLPLRHITVLEEAHNLLKRTSTEQSSETANLLGKSVEMLANAIAEMRTYGEGFIIADQSPGLLDMSVIRNTNTKIILRLPDEGDRELVGKAAGLNDDQVIELAKLQCGVAAVYQNDWIQPVLCKVQKFEKPEKQEQTYNMDVSLYDDSNEKADELKGRITQYLLSNILKEHRQFDLKEGQELEREVLQSDFNNVLKTKICDFLSKNAPPQSIEPITGIISGMYACRKEMLDTIIPGNGINVSWAKQFNESIHPPIDKFDWESQKYIMQCIAIQARIDSARFRDLPYQLQKVL